MKIGGHQPHCGPSAVISQMGATDREVAKYLRELFLVSDEKTRRRCFHCRIVSVLVQPVEGLKGEWECIDVAACEARILEAA